MKLSPEARTKIKRIWEYRLKTVPRHVRDEGYGTGNDT
jgi:hypothetical protein